MTQRTYNQYCPIARALDLVGERWTLLIIRNLFLGPKRFSDLSRGLPGIGTNILTVRLKALEESGLVRTRFLPPPAASSVYELTDYGRSLEDVLRSLALWGAQSLSAPEAGQVFSAESVSLMLYMLFTTAAASTFSGIYAVKIESKAYSADFGVKVQGQLVSVEQAIPGAYNLVLRADLATFGALATQHVSFKAAIANGMLALDGLEAEIVRFLAHFAPI